MLGATRWTLVLLMSSSCFGVRFAVNMIRPYDRFLWTAPRPAGALQVNAYGSSTFHEKGVQWDHTKVGNVLQMYECDQSTLAMVHGFCPDSTVGQLAAQLTNVPDDGVRGHVRPQACWSMYDLGVGVRYWLPHSFQVGLYLPIRYCKVSGLEWVDCTSDIVAQDYLTKELLTDNLASNMCRLGGLDIVTPYKTVGLGDLSFIAAWERNFAQAKPILTDVLLSLYLGLSLPTGKCANEDHIFSVPFGYDGATGILFGGVLGLTWKNHFTGGVEAHLVQLMGNTRNRRIKTDWDQSELFLLAKTPAHMDWGFLQRYRLYLGMQNIIKGASLELGYQFYKQGNSTLSLCSNNYIAAIANSACSLKEWTLHQLQVNASYNCNYNAVDDERWLPYFGLFYQHDFKGRRALRADRIGAFITLSF